jgi:folate-dependent phosphoribosylglycinamide formyltransferase PurN
MQKKFKILILNQQKNTFYLHQLISIIKKEHKENFVDLKKKINLNDLKKEKYSLLISFHNNQILKKNLIKFLNGNCINFHTSLLPENKGFAPILWSAINNNNFGISIHQIDCGLDTGPVILRKKIIIKNNKKNLNYVYHKIEKESIKLFKKNFKKIKNDIKQNNKITIFKKPLQTKSSYQSLSSTKKIYNKLPLLWSTKIGYLRQFGKNLKFIEKYGVKKYNLSNNNYFKQLQRTIIYNLTKTSNKKKMPIILEKLVNYDLRNNQNLMIKCENLVKKILKTIKVDNFMSMQYPINIRVSNSKRYENINHAYNTENLHCDAWSGAPSDSLNGFIYIYYQKKAPSLDLYMPLEKKDKLRNYLGAYQNVNIIKKNLKKINFPKKVGAMALWETYTPHNTNKKNTKENFFRISVDFRIKASDPYSEIHINKKNKFYNSKMNSDGVYWIKKQNKNFKSKIESEINYARKLSKIALKNRQIYLNKFYK